MPKAATEQSIQQSPEITKEMQEHINKEKAIKAQYDKDHEMVRGIFSCKQKDGGGVSFCYRKYKQDKIKKWEFVDGKVYTIPLYVAKHLNSNGWYPTNAYIADKDGNPIIATSKKNYRFGFQGLEFTDITDPDRAAAFGPNMIE